MVLIRFGPCGKVIVNQHGLLHNGLIASVEHPSPPQGLAGQLCHSALRKLYRPIWDCDRAALPQDFGTRVMYGSGN